MDFGKLISNVLGALKNSGNYQLTSPFSPNYEQKLVSPRPQDFKTPVVSPTPSPTPAQMVPPVYASEPSPTPQTWQAPPVPSAESTKDFQLNYAPYLKNPARLKSRFGTEDPTMLPQPSQEQLQTILQYFPNDATRAGIVRLTEDRLNDSPPDYTGNRNGSVDSGAFMNNSHTFDDMMSRGVMAKRIANRGIQSFADLKRNVELATRMAQLTADPNKTGTYRWGGYSPPTPTQPLGTNKIGPWFGPNDAGFDLSKQLY